MIDADLLFEIGTIIFSLNSLLAMLLGVSLGLIVGTLPGMGGSIGIALLTPAIYGMDAEPALMMLVGLYVASRFGGAIGAILFNVPGTASSSATAMDGYPMMRKGKGAEALGLAAVSSWVGGTIAIIITLFLSPLIASIALAFGPAEYFLLALFGLTIIASLSRGSVFKGLIAGMVGVFIGTIGSDPMQGTLRFTFSQIYLFDGIHLIWAIIGLFGAAEAIKLIQESKSLAGDSNLEPLDIKNVLKVMKNNFVTVIRSSIIGVVVGAIPGTGGTIASWLSYNETKRFSKDPDMMGKGAPEGVIAAETTDNAAACGSLIPTFALGIPGSGVTAILIGSLMIVGVQPGPRMFTQHAVTTYSILFSIFISNFMFLALGLAALRWMAKIAKIPGRLLVGPIIVLATIGAYTARYNIYGVYIMFGLGIIGYIFKKTNFSVASVVIGLILGPILEANLHRSLMLSGGRISYFYDSIISIILIVLTLVSLTISIWTEINNTGGQKDDN